MRILKVIGFALACFLGFLLIGIPLGGETLLSIMTVVVEVAKIFFTVGVFVFFVDLAKNKHEV